MKNNIAAKYILWMVVMVIATTELALDFYLPMLSQIRHEFGASEALIEITMSVYLIGMGVSALIYGNFSDIWGRRKLFVSGMLFFVIGSVGCFVVSNNVYLLIFCRLIQGMGGGVAWSVGNATMRDLFTGKEFANAITLLHLIAGVMPIIAPTIGGYIGNEYGWRVAFLALIIVAVAALLVLYFCFPETNHNRQRFSLYNLLYSYAVLLTSRHYWRFAIVKVLAVSIIFVDLSNITLIFVEHYGLSAAQAGYYVSAGGIAYVFGGVINTRLLRYISTERLIIFGMLLIAAGYAALLGACGLGVSSPMLIQLLKIPTYTGFAIVFANATCCIVEKFPAIAGSASALMITLEMLVSALGINLVSMFLTGDIEPVSYYALTCLLLAAVGFMNLRAAACQQV